MSLRKERLADQIRDILADSLSGGKMQDPALDAVAVTGVRLTGDLQIAKVYFRAFGTSDKAAVQDGLQRASGYFRRLLAEALDIRRVPELRFYFDESPERAARIEELLSRATAVSDADVAFPDNDGEPKL